MSWSIDETVRGQLPTFGPVDPLDEASGRGRGRCRVSTRLGGMVQAGDKLDAARWDAVEEATELLREERFVEAMLALRNVIQADPKNPYAYSFLGTALFDAGQREAARDAYRAAIALAPNYLGARVGL